MPVLRWQKAGFSASAAFFGKRMFGRLFSTPSAHLGCVPSDPRGNWIVL